MSTATIPFSCRHGFFPFCSDQASDPTDGVGDPMRDRGDYVALPVVNGDAGLRAAMDLYWRLERVSFTPSGTAGYIYTGGTPIVWSRSFSQPFAFPQPDTGNLDDYDLRGSIVASTASITDPAALSAEPAYRQCQSSSTPWGRCAYAQIEYLYGTFPNQIREGADVQLQIAYVGGEWRLYYTFFFALWRSSSGFLGVVGGVANPQLITWRGDVAEGGSGTVSLFGVELAWSGFRRPDSGSDTYSMVGAGLTASADIWSF